jgi:tetratricopeptide (TPR) repeat protein
MCNVRWVFSLISTLAVLGCAGVGVVASSDPAVKLRDAEVLYSEEQRPLIAERLIREAIHIYEEHGDSLGLGHAYRSYGKLLLSSSIIQWSQFYREHGFQDKSVTFDNRREKAKDYFAKSLDYFKNAETSSREAGQFDRLTKVYYDLGVAYYLVEDRDNSCRAFDQSVDMHAETIRRNPNAKAILPPGYASFADLVASVKKRAGCD